MSLPFWFVQLRPNSPRDARLAYAAEELGCHTAMDEFALGALAQLPIPLDRPSMIYGSIGLARAIIALPTDDIRRQHFWCHWSDFACSRWLEAWQGHTLSRDWQLVDLATISQQVEALYASLGERDKLFLRPDGADKDYDGGVIPRDLFNAWHVRAHRWEQPADARVFVARPVDILAEYRLFVVDGKVAAASRYRVGKMVDVAEGCPEEAIKFADRVLKIWAPAPIFALDVAETHLGFAVVECNPFHIAGLYEANLHDLVAAINRFVTER